MFNTCLDKFSYDDLWYVARLKKEKTNLDLICDVRIDAREKKKCEETCNA